MPRAEKTSGRRHVRHACEACKSSKRKCDGQQPCAMCTRYEFACKYTPREKRKPTSVTASPKNTRPALQPRAASVSAVAQSVSGEATSGVSFLAGFVSQTGTTGFDDAQPLAWNLALHESSVSRLEALIVLPQQARHLSAIYFDKVQDLYDFIDKASLNAYIESQDWPEDSRIPIFYGVLAIGSFFEQTPTDGNRTFNTAFENALMERARVLLENCSAQGNLSFDNVAGWILQVLYNRLTRRAISAWLASCTLMHLIQALGLESEDRWPKFLQDADRAVQELFRRQFWTAYLLHSWISFELGKPRIELSHACDLPDKRQSAFQEKLEMYQLSIMLAGHPGQSDCDVWLAAFEKAWALTPSHDELVFDQTILCLSFYRHIRLRDAKKAELQDGKLISMGSKGLRAAMNLMQNKEPWWHVASVPFQLLCIFLLMDCQESLSAVVEAMDVISATATTFPSKETQRSEQTAMKILQMVHKRKESHAEALKLALAPYGDRVDEQHLLDPMCDVHSEDLDWIWNELLYLDQTMSS